MTRTCVGVDLSKDWIDMSDPRSGHSRLPNREADLRRWLSGLPADSFLVFEATSLCDQLFLRLASALGRPFHRLNPLHGWHFGRSLNLPKTDRVDAAMLARLGAERRLAPSPGFAAARATLAELTGRGDQLKRMEVQEKNRLAKTFDATVPADIEDNLRQLAGRVGRIEAAIMPRRPACDRPGGRGCARLGAGGRMPGALRAPGGRCATQSCARPSAAPRGDPARRHARARPAGPARRGLARRARPAGARAENGAAIGSQGRAGGTCAGRSTSPR